ncbi:sterile alpha and tir motif-containing protein 1 [Plakobranchus ocellatus]|uniref:ADP-ribosyl cyclase/cyclic ADP-ribose hydrolase n=1 Tax=Plakobranchus ocellatus TaxID=259542 RepID=A0AAV4C655_9GAST|nr:sterile alpha and tir motif-containing protein 1 [Plakobranchus ocellatus]
MENSEKESETISQILNEEKDVDTVSTPLSPRTMLKKDACFDASKLIERSQSDALLLNSDTSKQMHIRASSLDQVGALRESLAKSKPNISETSKVYFDLSRMENSEGDEEDDDDVVTPHSKNRRLKKLSSSGSRLMMTTRGLETIHQGVPLAESDDPKRHPSEGDGPEEKELTSQSAPVDMERYMRMRSYQDPDDAMGYGVPSSPLGDDLDSSDGSSCFYTKYPLRFPHGYSLSKYRHNLKLSYQTLSQKLEHHIGQIRGVDLTSKIRILHDILNLTKEAWDTPVYGRDLAYSLCDIIRMEGLLDNLIQNCSSTNRDLLLASANLLEQVMSTRNRERVAKDGLEAVVKMTRDFEGDLEMAQAATGILENMFKLSEETCTKVINLGGLNVILRWCRCGTDYSILRRCAKALANLSLFGGAENQEIMSKHKVPEWLFPLAFSDDNSIRYYACLAISALVANKELEASVIKSGTLELVLPFINSNKPSQFATSDVTHKQGRDKIWLKHLIPLLFSRRQEAQALAAFHFAMEAIIKAEQGRQEIFHEIDAVEPLKKIASSPNTVASKLAAEALKNIGEKIPHKLSQQVPLWTVDDVVYWITQIGFEDYAPKVRESHLDGDLLLILTDEDLQNGLNMKSSIVRKRFARELKSLKITADYSISDPTGLDSWLMSLNPELSQYTYWMLRHGVDKYELKSLSEEELKEECGIHNSIHRRKILARREDLVTPETPSLPSLPCGTDPSLSINLSSLRSIDVFICYRRSSGSQLASLLKVHLQLKGFSVFLDIDRLRAGKFDENLLLSIQMSSHFVLILTPDALDRCLGDDGQEDWVHKEIVAALETNCNIVPIIDNFEWPPLEKIPADMRGVVRFNSVRWVHEYQDACVEKLETFLRRQGRRHSQQQQLSSPSMSSMHSNVGGEPQYPHTSPSLPSLHGSLDSQYPAAVPPYVSTSVTSLQSTCPDQHYYQQVPPDSPLRNPSQCLEETSAPAPGTVTFS